jgi:hypothetical protein
VGISYRKYSYLSIAINQATNTVYATNVGNLNGNPFLGNGVYVFNGASCDATHRSGCGQAPAVITVGPNVAINPWGIAVDQATDTVYTADINNGEGHGTVSVINGSTCNGTHHRGCGQTPATVTVGFGALGIAVDSATDTVYVTNQEDNSVSVIKGATCNGTDHRGCRGTHPRIAVGNYPRSIAVDPTTGTGYVTNGDDTISVTRLIG